MKPTETVVPESNCPFCGHKFDRASSFEGKTPKPGDITLCINCSSALGFTEKLKVREISKEEWETIHPITRNQILELQRAVRALDRRPTRNSDDQC